MAEDLISVLTCGHQDDPFAVRGPHCVTHESGPTIVVRAFLSMAMTVTLHSDTSAADDAIAPRRGV